MAISPQEIVLLVLVGILLFGASRLPRMGRSLGEGMRGFKDGLLGRGQERPEIDT